MSRERERIRVYKRMRAESHKNTVKMVCLLAENLKLFLFHDSDQVKLRISNADLLGRKTLAT